MLFSFHTLFALDVNEKIEKLTISSDHLLTYIDKDQSKSFQEILANQDQLFLHVKKNIFDYTTDAVWTKLRLDNKEESQLQLYLLNNFVALDEVDVYLVKNDTLYDTFFFGDMRAVNNTEILNRFTNVKLTLEAKEHVDIFIRYTSTTPINTSLQLFSESFYERFIFKDFTIWGFFVGISLALILYNLMIYLSLKEKAFLFYVLHVIANIYNTLTRSGHIYALLSPIIPNELLDITYKISPSLGVIFMCLFIIYLFDLKKNIVWLYRINVMVIYCTTFFMLSLVFFYNEKTILGYNAILAILVQLSLVFMLFSAFVIAYKRLSGSLYFVCGTGILIFSILLYALHFSGFINLGIWSIYVFAFGRIFDIVFLSMALGKRIKLIEQQRLENALLIEQSNKFNSTSYLLAGILHQFKQPVIHLGSEVLNLQALYYKKNQEDKKEEGILKNMESQVANMSALVENFYSFYSSKSQKSNFNLKHTLSKTLSILHASLSAYKIDIKQTYDVLHTTSDEKILSQICLIVLENAISALVERKINHPMIDIHVSKKESLTHIVISDNAGGIKEKDINKIFTVHYSKRENEGLGIGLALAKNLVENRLGGKINVENNESGASFSIII